MTTPVTTPVTNDSTVTTPVTTTGTTPDTPCTAYDLPPDVWVLICGTMSPRDLARAMRVAQFVRVGCLRAAERRYGRHVDAWRFSAACRIDANIAPACKRNALFALLREDVRMYARRRDPVTGTKMDELRLYKIVVVDFNGGAYRYSSARVVGEYREDGEDGVWLDRLFAVRSPGVAAVGDIKCATTATGEFDEDRAWCRLWNHVKDFTDPADVLLIPNLFPLFGFFDRGNVFARSAQCVAVNPMFYDDRTASAGHA
jgi:hypothetical protein